MADLSQFLYGNTPTQAPEAPEGTRVPWQGLPPARADQLKQSAYEHAQKYLQDNASVVSKGANQLNLLEQFGELNRKSRTGDLHEGVMSSFFPESWRGSDEKVMQSLTADIAPNKRIEGSGTTSDKDIALYLQSLPDISKGGDTNKAIRDNYRKQYERANQKLQFMQSYFDQYGHLNGADALYHKKYKVVDKAAQPNLTKQLYNEADAIINQRN